MDYKYHDPERVDCLKKDFSMLDATDQAALVYEFIEENAIEIEDDWKTWLKKAAKWLACAILGFIATACAFFGLASCTFSQSQVDMDGVHKEMHLQVNPVGDSLGGLFNFFK